jgi:hypothetical protein
LEDKMTAETLSCDVCNGESGGTFVGVAAVPGAPCSIAWCSECIKRDSAPVWIFEHDFIYVANGDLEALNEWARSRVTWVDGKYVGFEEFVKRITPEEVKKGWEDYIKACNSGWQDGEGRVNDR